MKKRKKKLSDYIFYAFVIAGLLIGYLLINKTMPERERIFELTDLLSTEYHFRNDKLLSEHYQKHGMEMGFDDKESYEKAASDLINNPDSLHKTEAEDGDDVYFLEATGEFAVLSTDGYIRTYFIPDAGKDYYDRQ